MEVETGDSAITTSAVVTKGLRFSVPEWQVVAELLASKNLSFTDLTKTALAQYARRNGRTWPKED